MGVAQYLTRTFVGMRASWSGKWGFIFGAAASAVGLGNIWRFPYLAARYGGGMFLLVYVILVVTFGYTLMIAESALGRRTRLSTIGAFKHYGNGYSFIGVIASIVPFIITSYYAVIGGWVSKYMVLYCSTPAEKMTEKGFFVSFITDSGFSTFGWFLLFFIVTGVVLVAGVKNGIERLNKVFMPLLCLLGVAIAVFSLTMPGAFVGIKAYLVPDFSKFSPQLVLAALGQVFFSLSLAMGIMVTYGSYLSHDVDLEGAVRRVELFDTGIAFLAGLMVIPAAVALTGSMDEVANHAGPGFMFGVLPQVFAKIGGSLANVVGAAFFILVFIAALTSCISLLETCVSIVKDFLHLNRLFSLVFCFVVVGATGVVVNLGYNYWIDVDLMHSVFGIGKHGDRQLLDFFDFIANSVMVPVVALLTCIFVGWIIKPAEIINEVKRSSPFRGYKLFTVMVRYVAPILVIVILAASILEGLGIIKL